MTDKNLERANQITKDISVLQDIRRATFKPYMFFRRWNGMVIEDDRRFSICDEGLNKVIEEYCDKRIKELRTELEAL